MVVVSYSGKEINAKLVYYGPGLSGKTTNLEHIYQSVPATSRGKMVSMKTRTERTLFFDFLPVDLGEIGGFKTRFLLYTVPGQVYYNATRKLVLRGVDAVIFVADSGQGKMEENLESLENLRENLREYGLSLDDMPWVIQYNKRDLPNAYSLEELEAALNPGGVPSFEAVATSGQGVFECFRGTARILLQKLSQEIKLGTTKPSALTAPRPGEGTDTASSAPPPGLMSGATPGKGYRPPVPTPKPGAVPPAVPHPPRPSVPTPAPIDPTAGGMKPYRPPQPRQAPAPVSGPTAPPRPPADPAPRPGSSRVMPSPLKPAPAPEPVEAGASWFEEEATPEPTSQVEEVFAPTLELDEQAYVPEVAEPNASWVNEAGGSQSGYIETIRDDEIDPTPGAGVGEGIFEVSSAGADEEMAPLPSMGSHGLGHEADDDLSEFEDEEPGFWGRLFRRKTKDRAETEQFRRYPTPDLASKSKPIPDLASTASPEPVAPPEPVLKKPPFSAEPPREPFYTAPEPSHRSMHRETHTLPVAPTPPRTWDEGPVVIERTIQVPIALGGDEVRRGAVLKLTLEVVVDGSQARLDRDRAA